MKGPQKVPAAKRVTGPDRIGQALVVAAAFYVTAPQLWALKTIAGYGGSSQTFAGVESAIDRLARALIWPGLALAFVGIVLVACMLIAGSPRAGQVAGTLVAGVIVLAGAPGIWA